MNAETEAANTAEEPAQADATGDPGAEVKCAFGGRNRRQGS